MEIRKFPEQEKRVETGPVQFGEDWPGLFIRGDNAFAYAMYLEQYLHNPYGLNTALVRSLIELLREPHVR